jgi:hypothetical protein
MKTLIGIVIPSGDLIHADTACALAMNVAALTRAGINFALINPKCSLVQKGRYIGVWQALDAGCSHVMFIDSDMVMPANTIVTLLSHDKDIVGCYYPKRQKGNQIVGVTKDQFRPFDNIMDKGLQKAHTLGCGMLMIKTEVFKNMPQPWFHVEFNDGLWTSEDEYFCLNSDYMVYCDCDLSKHIGHIGSTTYRSA